MPPFDAIRDSLGQLRKRLLDLSSRNRLLNFKHTTGKSLQFIHSDMDAVLKHLLSGPDARVALIPVPEPGANLWVTVNGRRQRPPVREHAQRLGLATDFELAAGRGGRDLRVLYYPDELATHARKLAREAKSAIEETGANMLFLVFGFLEFPDVGAVNRQLFAPLIVVPVAIEKTSVDRATGIESYALKYTGEDFAENFSLREKLKQDHSMELPEFDEENLRQYFREVSRLLDRKPDWHVRPQVTLALLSFAKMLLYRDMDPKNWPGASSGASVLEEHPVVQKVLQGRGAGDGDDAGVPSATEHVIDGHELQHVPLIYDADSSQHSALIDVLQQRNLVIEGPPGTGKSQTITNIVGACLASGKTVLFVSEKLAALQVVRKRLELAGLADFCLELHSNKTQKKHVLEELERRLAGRYREPYGLQTKLQLLEDKRKHLAAYAELLNACQGNACNLTVHEVLWRAERYRRQSGEDWLAMQKVVVPPAPTMNEASFQLQSAMLAAVAEQYRAIGVFGPAHPYWGLYVKDLLPDTALSIEHTLRAALPAFQRLAATFAEAGQLLAEQDYQLSGEQAATLLDFLDRAAPLDAAEMAHDMLPRLFHAGDLNGTHGETVLRRFETKLKAVATLRSQQGHVLLPTASIGEVDGQTAADIERQLPELGLATATTSALEAAEHAMRAAVAEANRALDALQATAGLAGRPFDDDEASVQQLLAVLAVAAAAPKELLAFRHAGLGLPNAATTLAQARREFEALAAEGKALDATLYMDSLPDEAALTSAIGVLRRGDAWYRVFQGDWRRACQLHRTLDRTKAKKKGAARLQELERLQAYRRGLAAWRGKPAYRAAMGPFFHDEAPQFTEAERLCAWYAESHRQLVAAGVEPGSVLSRDETHLGKLAGFHVDAMHAAEALYRLPAVASQHLGSTPFVRDGVGRRRWMQKMTFCNETCDRLGAWVLRLREWVADEVPANVALLAVRARAALPAAIRGVESDVEARELLGERYQSVDTLLEPAFAALTYGREVWRAHLPPAITTLLLSDGVAEHHRTLTRLLKGVRDGWESIGTFIANMERFGTFVLPQWAGADPSDARFAASLVARTEDALAHGEALLPWVQYVQAASRAREHNLGDFVEALEDGKVDPAHLVAVFGYRFFASIAQQLFASHRELAQFAGATHEQVRVEFRKLDHEVTKLRGAQCAHHAVQHRQPPRGHGGAMVGDKTDLELIAYMIQHPRTRVTLRKMMKQAGRAVQALKPCFMMSPQSVAQFLDPAASRFDVVVMDEASQLRPEDAIGAVARGAQLVVVGDPKQLPPTSFFDKLGTAKDGDDEHQSAAADVESILDVCMAHFQPVRTLRWHYRSRHQSLIAFSNYRFYRNNLIVFPSPYEKNAKLGLRYHYLRNAEYKSQLNHAEAARVVGATIDHMQNHPGESLGIVTLNLKQRDLVEELLEARCRNLPATDRYRARWEEEGQGLFVKNLENVQGDERDVIFISTTFGPSKEDSTTVRQNFGPISRQGGGRRLNVLFTRARKAVHVFTSMSPDDIKVDEGTPEGTCVLKEFLEYARTGILVESGFSEGDAESDFEIAVGEMLTTAGYEVVPQLGVAGFRIDLAVCHPRHKGAYIAAIECDGATYHSGVSVRDRDRIRQEILEDLGWRGRIWRIWSTDWFRNPKGEAERLLAFLAARAAEPIDATYFEALPDEVPEPLGTVLQHGIAAAAAEPPRRRRPAEVPSLPLFEEASAEETKVAESVVLIDDEDDDLEVEVGDLVTYASKDQPDQPVIIRIVSGRGNLEQGIIPEATPLARTLLGSTAGDEVVLRQPGRPPQTLVVHKVERPLVEA